jgi:effector-binding domain-containing protein
MIDEPTITQTKAQPTAIVHVTVAPEKLPTVMKPGIDEVRAALAAQGIATAGPWFAHYLRMEATAFELEIRVPVASPVAPAGRVKPGQLPAVKVARTIHHGPYEGLRESWGEFSSWIKSHGHTPGPDLWECYVVGPESGLDASKWRTELNRPLS